MPTSNDSPRHGRCIVRINGNAFEGVGAYDGLALTLKGQLRQEPHFEGTRVVLYGPTIERTWPIGKVNVIEWLGDE